MPLSSIPGVPGVGPAVTASPKTLLQNLQGVEYLDGGRILDGNACGDWSNPQAPHVLTAGLLLGKLSASGKYAPTLLGVTQSAVGTSSTTLAVTPAQASEIARRVGASGTLTLAGPPAAGGTVASESISYSAVNATTGVLTITAPASAHAAGSVLLPQDGSQAPLVVLDTLYGVGLADPFLNRQDTPAPRLRVAGHLLAARVPGLTDCDASVQAWLKAQLNAAGRHFVFDNEY